jgi:hypothetical protein
MNPLVNWHPAINNDALRRQLRELRAHEHRVSV